MNKISQFVLKQKVLIQILFFTSILLKSFLGTGNLIFSKWRELINSLSCFEILSGGIFNGLKCLIWHQRKHF